MPHVWSTWNPLKPFGRERAEVIRILQEMLGGTLDCREWDSFLRIPMKGTPDLEAIRLSCNELSDQESMDQNGFIKHSKEARAKIQDHLDSLKKQNG